MSVTSLFGDSVVSGGVCYLLLSMLVESREKFGPIVVVCKDGDGVSK